MRLLGKVDIRGLSTNRCLQHDTKFRSLKLYTPASHDRTLPRPMPVQCVATSRGPRISCSASSMLPDAYGSDSILRHGQTSSLAMARSSPSSCTVTVKFIFTILSIVFLTLGGVRFIKDNCTVKPAAKTWLLIGCIFAAMSAWLFISQ